MASLSLLFVLLVIVFAAGMINGLAGFGFAMIGTMALASVIEPTTAVVFMIIPILAVNLSLVRELTAKELHHCGRRFWPLLGSALVGTLIGMAIVDVLPPDITRVGLGVLTLLFVISVQRVVSIPLEEIKRRCFVEHPGSMVVVGTVSGLIFGATNVGVQLVAYVRSFQLAHATFVGVIAMIFLGLNGIRVSFAGLTGMYGELAIVLGSLLVAAPAVAGVAIGLRMRIHIPNRKRQQLVVGLLGLIGIRLLLAGFHIV